MNRSDARKRTTSVVTGGRLVTDAYGAGSRSKPQAKATVVTRDKPMRCRCCPDTKAAPTKSRPTVPASRYPQQPLWVPSVAAAAAPPPPEEQRTFIRKCCPVTPDGRRSLGSARSLRGRETTISCGDGDGLGDNVTVSHRGATRDRANSHLGHLQCGQGLDDWREPKEKRFDRLAVEEEEEKFLGNVVDRCTPSSGSPVAGMLATTACLKSPAPRALSVSADIDLPQDDSGSRPDAECPLVDETEDSRLLRLLCQLEPLRTAQFLTEELAAKQRELGPEHRQLCQIGKQLSEVVQLLAKQQPTSVPATEAKNPMETSQTPAAASVLLEPGTKKDEIECCNCALIQRKWDEDRDRHTRETARLSEQINYLQQQLALAGNVEKGLKQTMTEHQQRLEQKLHELSATVDVKQCLEGPVIRAQHRKLKDTRNRLRTAEQDRATLQQRIADLVVDNEKKELLLQAQDTNIERVRSELRAIRQLSIRQIEYLDDTVNDTVTTASHHQAAVHNYPPSIDTPVAPATDDVLRPGTSQPAPRTQSARLDAASSSSFTSGASLVPDGARMPSVTAPSDRDERSLSGSSRADATLWMNASMLTLCTTSASMWSLVPPVARDDDDDHRHLIADLTESVTLPSSPVPFGEEEKDDKGIEEP